MTKAQTRVAITGIGMINSLGTSAPVCWSRMLRGETGIRTITHLDTSECGTKIGGELTDDYYEIERNEFSKRKFKQTQLPTRMGYLCAREAMQDSGFTVEGLEPYRCGSITGCGQAGYSENSEDGDAIAMYKNPGKFIIIQQMPNALAGWLCIDYGLKGRSFNVSTACASGAHALASAWEYIESGRGDMMLVVGFDSLLTTLCIKGFNSLAAISRRNDAPEKAMRPFDRDRDGFVLANGGAALVLESEAVAAKRNARVYAYMTGAAMCTEAYNIVAPKPSGEEMARAMTEAMKTAGVSPEQVQYISAHGTSTLQNDADETAGIKMAFGAHAKKLQVSSQKSMTGHTIGGAGAIECAATALCLYHGVITPTINLDRPDTVCDLDYVPNETRQAKNLKVALSNSFGFGGHNATLVLEKAN